MGEFLVAVIVGVGALVGENGYGPVLEEGDVEVQEDKLSGWRVIVSGEDGIFEWLEDGSAERVPILISEIMGLGDVGEDVKDGVLTVCAVPDGEEVLE